MRKKHSSKLIDEIMSEVLRRLKEEDNLEKLTLHSPRGKAITDRTSTGNKNTTKGNKESENPIKPLRTVRKGQMYGPGGVHPLIGV